ncbi:SseB family protein [Ruicaihuangia caeni]|uniref:SseB family protein n=1 Tax=Ruicaihuangia caeni TaxID=3042517 RepID=UPI00338D70D5
MGHADSAGVPWEGREFQANPHANDDGRAPRELDAALRGFREGTAGADAVVDAVRSVRLLVPLVAELGEAGENEHGQLIDKSQELSIVTVAGPDGRNVMPVFSSVDAMQRWNAAARPIPVDGQRVALAAASEQTDLVIIDPGSEHEFVVRRPALWAIAQGAGWRPAYDDPDVIACFSASVADEPAVQRVEISSGDPDHRLQGPEVLVRLTLAPGLDQQALSAVLSRLQQRWATETVIAERVDSMTVKLAAGPSPA